MSKFKMSLVILCVTSATLAYPGSAHAQEAKVVVELVPDHPGPYTGDQLLTVDVWLHSQVSFDAYIDGVQLDFSASDPALRLGQTFLFDLSAVPDPEGGFSSAPAMPVPVAGIFHGGIVGPEDLLPLPAKGSLHIGSIGVRFPATTGVYRLDAMNSDVQESWLGAQIETDLFPGGDHWFATAGEITGGTFDFFVDGPPIPTVSQWGLIVMTLLLLVLGSLTLKRRRASRISLVVVLLTLGLGQSHALAQDVALNVSDNNGSFELSLDDSPPFHVTTRQVTNARLIDVTDSTVRVALWDEVATTGQSVPFYAVFLDGAEVNRVTATSYDLKLRFARFDPANTSPAIPATLQASPNCRLFIVQFVTQPLEAYRTPIQQLGGTIHNYLAQHAHIVRMDPARTAQVAVLPFVRSVTPYHPAYRLEEFMRDNLDQSGELFPLLRYNVQVFDPSQKNVVSARIEALGGTVNTPNAGKFLLQATLTPEQLYAVTRWDEVLFVDRWGPYEVGMNNARSNNVSGANYLETVAGFTGQGVRGEVFDNGFNLNHQDFLDEFGNSRLSFHGAGCSASHGMSTSGIVFGNGGVFAGGGGNIDARGVLPDGEGIVACSTRFTLPEPIGTSRHCHTCELVTSDCSEWCDPVPVDPNAPYEVVFQTASTGSRPNTNDYTPISADIDALLFDFDVLLCQMLANEGTTDARQEAWAKNAVTVGGIKHDDNDDLADDSWCESTVSFCAEDIGCASMGPAEDGRIKPDLVHFYDCVLTVGCCQNDSYTNNFGGTSAATPITCGYFGLMFQMWHEEAFCGFGGGTSVFDSRPHMSTAKALMINTANSYQIGVGGQADFTRDNQGWGMVDVQSLYDLRDNIFIVNETDILVNFWHKDYYVIVAAGEPELRVTMVYTDPPGTTSSSQHRINDLTLKVTSPSGTVYWGNYGLDTDNWSASGGLANSIDTVENVFLQTPEVGTWTVRIRADEVIEDSHVETPAMDADFALVVTGARADCNSNGVGDWCDITSGTSSDCFNGNRIPDECESIFRGACCFGGVCVPQMTQCLCFEQRGTFQGIGSGCGPAACGGSE